MRSVIAVIVLILGGNAMAASLAAQSWRPPDESERCPSRWGEGDERGAANHMTPRTVLQAARLIRTGEVFELGHVLSERSHGARRFELYTKRTSMDGHSNHPYNTDELVISEIGQVGTQLDGFAHQAIGNSLYNCFALDETVTSGGFRRLGVENVGTIFTRGVLIDIAGLKGIQALQGGYEITVDDIQDALRREGVTLAPGDAVLIHTGMGRSWGRPYDANLVPGIGIAAAEWLAAQDPILVGADTPNVEVLPSPDPELFVPVHEILLTVHGIYLLESVKLDDLADRSVYEFAFLMQPLKIQGGTGSTVAPTAIR